MMLLLLLLFRIPQRLWVKEFRNAGGPITGCNIKCCTDACLRRYLEARNWNVGKAKKMLERLNGDRLKSLKRFAGMRFLLKVRLVKYTADFHADEEGLYLY